MSDYSYGQRENTYGQCGVANLEENIVIKGFERLEKMQGFFSWYNHCLIYTFDGRVFSAETISLVSVQPKKTLHDCQEMITITLVKVLQVVK